MNTHADKAQENTRESQSVANAVTQKKSSGDSTFRFVDNRPEAVAQRKLQEVANNSPQAKQAAQLQEMANNNSVQQPPIQKKENNTGLPDNLKSGIENLSGYSMDDVKVHYNSDKPAQLNAHAYAQGTDIHIASGQEKHLPHEAWHVVQQKQGRVKPTMQMHGGINVNDDVGLEKEADVMGGKALQLKTNDHENSSTSNGIFSNISIQRMVVFSGANPPEDSNIVATLPDTERSVGGPLIHESMNPNYGRDNKIAILSHGDQGSIEWKGGSWSGKKLVNDELLASGREITTGSLLELWSCSAGEQNQGNDSLVDEVGRELNKKSVHNVTVKGVKGTHVVLNDVGDHYVPKESVDPSIVIDVFSKLRSYYLWLCGFFSDKLISEKLGGFEQETVGTNEGTHPVLFPKDEGATELYIGNLRTLYEAERECDGIDSELSYEAFLKQRMESWSEMCSFLRTNTAFKAITQQVDADWYELKS